MCILTFSGGILTAAAWLAVNFFFTRNLLEIAILKRHKAKLLLLLLIKFPVLYLVGFFILTSKAFPISSLLIGMSLMLVVLGACGIWLKRSKPSTNYQI